MHGARRVTSYQRWFLFLLTLSVICAAHAHSTGTTCDPVDWRAALHFQPLVESESCVSSAPELPLQPRVRLIIGVKTNVLHGATARRSLRSTWANRSALPPNVRVVFLGCEPDISYLNETEAAHVQNAIRAEREEHGHDLLTEELLSCRDAYDDLVNKILAFFQWSASHRSADQLSDGKTFVMVVDDDIYLRLDKLLVLLSDPEIPAHRFYGGQVWATQYRRTIEPRREPIGSRYYLSRDHYALDVLPPFANGPHYILSADIAHFIGQHRAFFRGIGGDPANAHSVGTLDDVSVALWLLAMQIHPRHIESFANVRDQMCTNDLISYADLTPRAIHQIHANVERNRSICDGFSYVTWLKRFVPTHTRDHLDEKRRMDEWDRLTLSCRVERQSQVDPIHVYAEMTLKEAPERDTAVADFAPASMPFYQFCTVLAHLVASGYGVLPRQPVFVCQQIRTTLLERILQNLEQHPWKRPLVELLIHNLGNEVVAPSLQVVVTPGARFAMVVIENLLAQAYTSVELQVYEISAHRPNDRDPDVVFFSTAQAVNDTAARGQIQAFADQYPRSRLVLVHPRELSADETLSERIVVIGSSSSKAFGSRSLHLPLASTAFGSTNDYSPLELLQRRDGLTQRQRQFCIDDYASHQCDHPHREYFFNLLHALDRVDIAGGCPRHTSQLPNHNTSIHKADAFYLDAKVARYAPYKFTIAFEDAVNVPGLVGDTIVAAFLAGTIPIYYGHSATVAALFNPKAFIDCGAFSTLRQCAKRVLAVHASPSMYASMRHEAPIVNRTAFEHLFSWHPEVMAQIQERRNESEDVATQSDRLKKLLDTAS